MLKYGTPECYLLLHIICYLKNIDRTKLELDL